jgi:hypothetical protein
VEKVRIEHRVVGTLHLFTSPDVPGLFVADSDRATAERDVPAAIEMLRRMNGRRIKER